MMCVVLPDSSLSCGGAMYLFMGMMTAGCILAAFIYDHKDGAEWMLSALFLYLSFFLWPLAIVVVICRTIYLVFEDGLAERR